MDSIDELNYEAALRQLEAIIAELESGRLSLEESVAAYERGQRLSARCQTLLEQAELKITQVDAAGNIG